MRVRILQTVQLGSQTLNAGVECEVPQEQAEEWVARGIAQDLDELAASAANPVLDGLLDVPPAKPRRRQG